MTDKRVVYAEHIPALQAGVVQERNLERIAHERALDDDGAAEGQAGVCQGVRARSPHDNGLVAQRCAGDAEGDFGGLGEREHGRVKHQVLSKQLDCQLRIGLRYAQDDRFGLDAVSKARREGTLDVDDDVGVVGDTRRMTCLVQFFPADGSIYLVQNIVRDKAARVEPPEGLNKVACNDISLRVPSNARFCSDATMHDLVQMDDSPHESDSEILVIGNNRRVRLVPSARERIKQVFESTRVACRRS